MLIDFAIRRAEISPTHIALRVTIRLRLLAEYKVVAALN
jgi:hypothetical protein